MVVWLLNAAHMKAVPGRKSDVRDTEWHRLDQTRRPPPNGPPVTEAYQQVDDFGLAVGENAASSSHKYLPWAAHIAEAFRRIMIIPAPTS